METLFHLSFPVHDLASAKEFYTHKLGFPLGRESKNALIFQCGTNQLVAQKVDELPPEQESIYPRHFGLIFLKKEAFYAFLDRIKQHVPLEVPLKTRFENTPIEHLSFFLKDPSNNLLEFKYYSHYSAVFGEKEFKKIGDSEE